MLTHLMAAVASTWSRERCGMRPLDAVVSRPGVSSFIVDFAGSFLCKVKKPSRGLKWEVEGEEEGKGEVEKVNRGCPILLSLIMVFPHSEPSLPPRTTDPITTTSSTMPVPPRFYLQVQHGRISCVSQDVCTQQDTQVLPAASLLRTPRLSNPSHTPAKRTPCKSPHPPVSLQTCRKIALSIS